MKNTRQAKISATSARPRGKYRGNHVHRRVRGLGVLDQLPHHSRPKQAAKIDRPLAEKFIAGMRVCMVHGLRFVHYDTAMRLIVLCLILALSACATAPTTQPFPPARPFQLINADGSDFALYALGLVGTPYRFGGNDPNQGFDCSGLVTFVVLRITDTALPRRAADLARIGSPIGRGALRNGDLVFFDTSGGISHVGVYVGSGRFVHAPSSGALVRIDALDAPYWGPRYRGARRLTRQ